MTTSTQTKPLSKTSAYLRVLRILRNLRRRDTLRCFYEGWGRILLFLASMLAVRCVLDYWLKFSWGSRFALLVADAGIVAWIFLKYFLKPFRRRLTLNTASLRLQRFAPSLESRVIATVQLVPEVDAGRAPRSLVQKLLRETKARLDKMKWRNAVELRRPFGRLVFALLVGLGAGGLAWVYPTESMVLVSRYYLSRQGPIFKTQLVVEGGDMKRPRGGNVELKATTGGVVPEEVVFYLTGAEGVVKNLTVRSEEGRAGEFALMVENVQEPFSYMVEAGDAKSRKFRIEILEPPILLGLNVLVAPPAYTEMPSYSAPANTMKAPEGSELTLAGSASDDLAEALVSFHLKEQAEDGRLPKEAVSLEIGSDKKSLGGSLGTPAAEIAYLSVRLVGANGVESVNDARYPVNWIEDVGPEILLERVPEDESTVAVGQSVRVAGLVNDDYGLSDLRVCWSVERPDAEAEAVVQYRQLPCNGRECGLDFQLCVGTAGGAGDVSVASTPGVAVTWWIQAVDNCALSGGPNIVESEKYKIGVVTPVEKIAELMGRVRQGISSVEEMSSRQSEAEIKLRNLIENEESNP